ncbi:MAG: TetR/AcrR family transcriptional regulator [Clostridia bacterium]|nr:TetR/AcrR family transcriptional regulator [Clostridia bacterium]
MEEIIVSDTREKILMTALHLFARDGYKAVSVSTIAGELGMTKGALYKHYKNKRDIFDSIVERMYQIDAQRAKKYEVPQVKYEIQPNAYKNQSVEKIMDFTIAQFIFWTEDDFASDFRKMLTLEQYRNAEMAELYSQCIAAGPVTYMEDLFREMIQKGVLKEENPGQLAVEYYAPLFLLISMFDKKGENEEYVEILRNHTKHFMLSHGWIREE